MSWFGRQPPCRRSFCVFWAFLLLAGSECADRRHYVERDRYGRPRRPWSRLTNRRSRCGCAPPFPATLAELNMHRYRTHTCGALREGDIGIEARLSGWCHRIRDHGGVLFIDLRDHYGLTQVVADP